MRKLFGRKKSSNTPTEAGFLVLDGRLGVGRKGFFADRKKAEDAASMLGVGFVIEATRCLPKPIVKKRVIRQHGEKGVSKLVVEDVEVDS